MTLRVSRRNDTCAFSTADHLCHPPPYQPPLGLACPLHRRLLFIWSLEQLHVLVPVRLAASRFTHAIPRSPPEASTIPSCRHEKAFSLVALAGFPTTPQKLLSHQTHFPSPSSITITSGFHSNLQPSRTACIFRTSPQSLSFRCCGAVWLQYCSNGPHLMINGESRTRRRNR